MSEIEPVAEIKNNPDDIGVYADFVRPVVVGEKLYGPDLLEAYEREKDRADGLEVTVTAKDKLLESYEESLSVQGEASQKLIARAEKSEAEVSRLNKALDAEEAEHIAQAKAECASLRKMLENPSPELIKNCARRLLRFQDDSTDESFSALQWAECKQDAARVIAELNAAIKEQP